MPKKFIIPAISIFIFIVGGSILGYLLTSKESPKPHLENSIVTRIRSDLKVISINENKLYIELADTPNELAKGLSGKEGLNENEGMLFVFEEDSRPSFWMNDMSFSIDIIWINDGKITQVHQNVPFPNTNSDDSSFPLYKPLGNIDYVLEVNAGYFKKHNIAIGDEVDLGSIEKN